jgi:hypothetical protein
MNRKIFKTISIIAVATTMLTACNNTSNKTNLKENNASETVIDNFEQIISNETENNQQSDVSEVETAITTESTENETVSKEYTFEDLSKYSYEFCSGAGGWSTDFYIEKDGYFHGNYHDSDMGDIGEGYENGTMYSSVFTGHFSGLTKVDEYAYEMVMSDISYKNEVGTEEIADDIRYIYDEAYGLCGTKRFLVYFPGTPVNVFDEEVYWWIMNSVDDSMGDEALLQTPVIVNEDQQYGIYSYEYTFQTILEEQRSWLKQRDEQATTNRDSWEGGTFAEVDYQDTMATVTMERCEKLLEYVKQECN